MTYSKLATPLIAEFSRYADVKLPDNAAVIAQILCVTRRKGRKCDVKSYELLAGCDL